MLSFIWGIPYNRHAFHYHQTDDNTLCTVLWCLMSLPRCKTCCLYFHYTYKGYCNNSLSFLSTTLAPWPYVAFRKAVHSFVSSVRHSWHSKANSRSRFDLWGPLAGRGWKGENLVSQEERQQYSVKWDPHQETWAVCWGRTVVDPKERAF